MTSDLAQALLEAMRDYTQAQRADPRDQAAIDEARTHLDELVELRDGG